MRLINLLIIFSLIGCASGPKKPSIELCVIDYPANIADCGMTDPELIKSLADLEFDVLTGEIKASSEPKPLSYLDNAVAITQPHWKEFMDYLHKLEDYVRSKDSDLHRELVSAY